MVQLIPAHIENGHVIPAEPLPAAAQVRSVSILVELAESKPEVAKESTLPRLLGIIKDPGDWKKELVEYLEKKHQ